MKVRVMACMSDSAPILQWVFVRAHHARSEGTVDIERETQIQRALAALTSLEPRGCRSREDVGESLVVG